MKRRGMPQRKLNNKGLSLVELLIAVTILAIIIVPLLHTFVSSARLNNKSARTLKATMIAENIMEEFEETSVESLSQTYGVSSNSGVYSFEFDSANLTEFDTENFIAKVELNPNNAYVSYNAVSISDVNAITADHSAVYAMPSSYDETVYKIFEQRNTSARSTDISYVTCNSDYFEKNLNRSISVLISRGSQVLDGEGNLVWQVKVTLTMEYSYGSNASVKALLPSDLKYTETKVLFDNINSKKALEHVYLMYTPRYLACDPLLGSLSKDDVIDVYNLKNVECGMSVIREETNDDSTYLNNYLAHKKAKISIYEMPSWVGAYTTSTEGAINLRTNLLTTNPSTGIVSAACALNYSNSNGSQSTNGNVAEAILDLRTADGKNLDGSATKNRIYDMNVTVYHKSDLSKPIAVMSGTKID